MVSISSGVNDRGLVDDVRESVPSGIWASVVSTMSIIWFIVSTSWMTCPLCGQLLEELHPQADLIQPSRAGSNSV